MLRVWSNEFPILRDASTWEVQPPTFEMLPDWSLRRRVKGRPAIMKIQNDMDIREQVDPKHCTICRTVSHNRSKCHHENIYTGRSSRTGSVIVVRGIAIYRPSLTGWMLGWTVHIRRIDSLIECGLRLGGVHVITKHIK
ncbi:hypothetical protein PVK06_008351 [Gossypium arboreum]|uniref:Uncharacterized protein n=1 Tax=Gossypium arboreum TaxID=29729 RepID=A0ABR0QJQ4_GOSAR|nr:hypothetical protein PVK06_008351 [Gossypium arboreum]